MEAPLSSTIHSSTAAPTCSIRRWVSNLIRQEVRYNVPRHNWRNSRDRSARGRFRDAVPEVWQDVSQRGQFHRSRNMGLISKTDYSFFHADFSSMPRSSGALETTVRCVLRP